MLDLLRRVCSSPEHRNGKHRQALCMAGVCSRYRGAMAACPPCSCRQYDKDGDGSVDWEEFRQYVVRKERLVQRTFRKLDEDGDGSVSPEELVGSRPSLTFP